MLTPLRNNALRSLFLICMVSSVGAPVAAGGFLGDRSVGMERRAGKVLGQWAQDTGRSGDDSGKENEFAPPRERPPAEEWQGNSPGSAGDTAMEGEGEGRLRLIPMKPV
jgi:hypothetical protein